MAFSPLSRPTLIGSLPLKDHKEALEMVLKYTPEIPIWVQLPVYPKERLLTQFVSGLPGIRSKGEDVYFDTSSADFEAELLSFFEQYLEVTEAGKDITESRFCLDEEHAPGFFLLLKTVKERGLNPFALKGQITGTFTLLTGIKDQDQKIAYYDIQLREAVVKAISLKARFQIKKMKEVCATAICFFDEPALAGFGSSSFVGISKEDVAQDLSECINAVHEEGGICGVHVCANTDWSLILDSDVDILSFDAFGYFDRFKLFKEKIHNFLDKDKVIAWGLVPTLNQEDLESINIDTLYDMWQSQIEELEIPRDKAIAQGLITPSCGTGLLTKELSQKALGLTFELSRRIRNS